MKEYFGKINDEEIFVFTLENKYLKVELLNYGAILKSIIFNNKNVLLGFNDLESYLKDNLYTGGFVGRNAGRIKNALFKLDNNFYKLEQNDNSNNLHSGSYCYNKYVFNYNEISKSEIELSLKVGHMEDLFPGNLKIIINLKLSDNKLNINIKGFSDKISIFNPTYHSYFNLNGKSSEDILDHYLEIKSDLLLEISKDSIPTGKIKKINNTFDFNNAKKISKNINDVILSNQNGFDHPYILRNSNNNIKLFSKKSNIQMNMKTDLPSLIFYSGNFIPERYYNGNSVKRCGLCLEPQFYPDYMNLSYKNYFINKENPYEHNISYEFKII